MASLRQSAIRLVAVLLAANAALCPPSARAYAPGLGAGLRRRADGTQDATRDYAYAYDGAGNVVRAGRIDATGQGRAAFEVDGFNFHAVRRWNAIDLVGVAREDAQILVNQQPVLRDARRFVFALPLREGSSAHMTNLTVLARVSDDEEEWVAQQSVTLRVPACPEEIGTTLAGATVSDSLTEYLFDARNRLRRATDKIGEPRLQAVYDYYADDRRARKIVSVWTNDAWQASCTNQLIYDGWNLVREVVTDGGTVTTRDYTWGLDLAGLQSGTWSQEAGGIGGLLAITQITGTSTNILLPICDHVGTIHALVAAMTNSVALSQPCVVETRTYSPYGELIEVDAPLLTTHHSPLTSPCPFGFQSKYYDPETGFWNFGYRFYDAKSAKWLTADPLQEAGGLNLTAFCGGDPVNQIDPLGLAVWGDLDDNVDRFYREDRPMAAFLYDFGVRTWNGFSFGMLQRQSRQEDALADGDISLGRYAAGASVNMAISGAQLALTVGGVGRVATSAKGAASLVGVLGQGARIGGEIALLGGVAEQFGSHLSDTLAGVDHERTLRQEAASVLVQTGQGAAVGTALSGLSYGGLKIFSAFRSAKSGHKTADTWGQPKTLADHFTRHGGDFGAKTADEYVDMASDFLKRSQVERLPIKIAADGTIRVFDPKSGAFGSYNASGTTKTFYKPAPSQHKLPSNLDYWNNQPGVSPWEP